MVAGFLFVQCGDGEYIPGDPKVSESITNKMIELAKIAHQYNLVSVLQFFHDHPTSVVSSLNDNYLLEMCPAALHEAITLDDHGIIQALLSRGVDVNASTSYGFTPLHRAVLLRNVTLFKLLLTQADFNVNLKDNDGNTPLHLAAMRGCSDMFNVLLSCGARANINDKNCNGSTVLHLSVSDNRAEMVKRLLEDPTINVNLQDNEGDTPLHLALGWHDLIMFDRLLDKEGIELNIQNSDDCTPLHVAVLKNSVSAVEKLLQAGAMANLQDRNGNTPLHIAAKEKYWKIIFMLRAKGARLDIRNDVNKIPMELAIEHNGKSVAHRGKNRLGKIPMEKPGQDIPKTKADRTKPRRERISANIPVKVGTQTNSRSKPNGTRVKHAKRRHKASLAETPMKVITQPGSQPGAKRVKLAPKGELDNEISVEILDQASSKLEHKDGQNDNIPGEVATLPPAKSKRKRRKSEPKDGQDTNHMAAQPPAKSKYKRRKLAPEDKQDHEISIGMPSQDNSKQEPPIKFLQNQDLGLSGEEGIFEKLELWCQESFLRSDEDFEQITEEPKGT
ncbi:MAG: hypothetical protein BGO68_00280 [Candidatus Amoebophilus sp. 36-38]|nr:MAG: hypothetical protein BGO68_00280 [Candidatus Amoebophilus sp. 36-38]